MMHEFSRKLAVAPKRRTLIQIANRAAFCVESSKTCLHCYMLQARLTEPKTPSPISG